MIYLKSEDEISRSYDLTPAAFSPNWVTLVKQMLIGIHYIPVPKSFYDAEQKRLYLIEHGVDEPVFELFLKYIYEYTLATGITLNCSDNMEQKIDELEAELFFQCESNYIEDEILRECIDLYCAAFDQYLFKPEK